MNRNEKQILTAELLKVYPNDPGWVSHEYRSVASIATLPSGKIIPIWKQKIITNFLFGEQGYDYDDACRMANVARNSSDYFCERNMNAFTQELFALSDARSNRGGYACVIHEKPYCNQSPTCLLANYSTVRWYVVAEALGNDVSIREIGDRRFTLRGIKETRLATKAEIIAIYEAVSRAAAEHQKHIQNYLKRYGMSKVTASTYWIDA